MAEDKKEAKPKKATPKKATAKKAAPKKAAPKKAAPKKEAPAKVKAVKAEPVKETSGSIKNRFSAENRKLLFGAGGAVLAVAALILIVMFSGGGGKGVILAYTDSDYEVDLYTAVYGKANKDPVRIVKNIDTYTGSSYLITISDGEWVSSISGASFIPELGKIIFMYQDGSDVVVEQMEIGDEDTEEIFQTENSMAGFLFIDEGRLLIEESDSDYYCYFSDLKSEADRVLKVDSCSVQDAETFIVTDSDDLIIYDIDSDEEIELLRDVDEVSRYVISEDLSTVAYVMEDDDEEQLFMLDKKGAEVELSEEMDEINRVFFQPDSTDDGLFIGVDRDDPGIYRFFEDDPIIEEDYLTYSFMDDNNYVIILAGKDFDDITAYSYNMKKDDLVEIYSGEEVGFGFMPDLDLLFIVEFDGDDVVIFTSDFNGNNFEKIYDDDLDVIDSYTIPGQDKLFIEVADGDEYSLLVNDLGEESNYSLIDEWFDFQVLNYSPDGKYIVFQGQEDDDDTPALFIVEVKEDAEIIELYELEEDYFWVYNAVFTPNGKSILFSAPTGDDTDEVAVFEVPISGKDDAVEIYEEAILQDVEWGNLGFYSTDFYSYSAFEY